MLRRDKCDARAIWSGDGKRAVSIAAYTQSTGLHSRIRSRILTDVNGLFMHVLEAGHEIAGRPAILLLHGFPELAYSWRHVMGPMADAGFHVIAPDQRGYGRTCGLLDDADETVEAYHILNLVRDTVALTAALGLSKVDAVVGHDYGASIAAACTLVRPDLFRAVVIMSAPFSGPPTWPLSKPPAEDAIHAALAAPEPPRKHYHAYFATPEAATELRWPEQGLRAFLRAYFHMKSADWGGNKPGPLRAWSAEELHRMPDYYIMPLALSMPQAVASTMPNDAKIEACSWLTEEELGVYVAEYHRTGFAAGLQWYCGRMDGSLAHDLSLFSGCAVTAPALFVAGDQDWGPYQVPGGLERMKSEAFTDLQGIHFVEGAGHWVQQEKAALVTDILITFVTKMLS